MLVFRRITSADFFNIYKPRGAEEGGGGQSYIDVDTSGVSLAEWHSFFAGISPKLMRGGPLWSFEVNSLGLGVSQTLKIGQRRATSVSIREQKLESSRSNRLYAWHPDKTAFPRPAGSLSSSSDPQISRLIIGLKIFIIRATDDTYWAGWMRVQDKPAAWTVPPALKPLLENDDGFINLAPVVDFDETELNWPFHISGATVPNPAPAPSATTSRTAPGNSTGAASSKAEALASAPSSGRKFIEPTEEAIASDLFDGDYAATSPEAKEVVAKVRARNQKAVRALKRLYGECQITGEQYVFPKEDGDPYLEVHHLIPLGLGGADSPANLVVLSAHMHRMLHYAKVGEIDLSRISGDQLTIQINGDEYTIRWRPDHAAMIKAVE